MKILAMDPSLTSFGWALWEDGEAAAGVICPSSRGQPRVHEILKRVGGHCEGLTLALMEGYSFGSKGRGQYDGAEMRGVVKFYLWQYGIPLVEVPPSTLKMYATGRGNAPKNAVLVQAVKRLEYQGTSDDVADAKWILQLALAHYGLPGAVDLPKTHTRALEKIKWPELEIPEELRRVA